MFSRFQYVLLLFYIMKFWRTQETLGQHTERFRIQSKQGLLT